jgi:aminomethyltransferase
MVDFAGWEMPIQYQGIMEEHLKVRSAAGIFDVSHMGDIIIKGSGARDLLLCLLTNDVGDLPIWKAIYAHILNELGKIIDDTIVYRLAEEEYLLVPNASTTPKVLDWIMRNRDGQEVLNISSKVASIALQGPMSVQILQKMTRENISDLAHFNCQFIDLNVGTKAPHGMWRGRVLVARTGYTGEDGFELMFDNVLAMDIWNKLLRVGGENIQPIGLGARDTLRLEMGYLLSGTDFDGSQSSLQTGPKWVVKWDHDFIGKKALQDERNGNLDMLTSIELLEKGIPRHGYRIEKDGKEVGHVTSGTFSPSLRKGIALGYLPPELNVPGKQLDVVIRDVPVKAMVTKLPFYRRK